MDFQEKVLQNLEQAGLNLKKNYKIGVAVSGGADSVSLLISLCNIFLKTHTRLFVITVNHFIRPDKETCKDAEYVEELCKKLQKKGYDLSVKVCNLKKGSVAELSQIQNCGIEAAARTLRYKAFDEFINENKLDYLCLAHNQNDQTETLLLRFLQGAQTESSVGILLKRDKYLRPLLSIKRKEIEAYLKEKKVSYRTDSTNLDTAYLRNKIRLKLVPLLDKEFPGWENSVLTGAQKNAQDSELINSILQKYSKDFIQKKDEVLITRKAFHSAPDSIKRRLILKAIDCLTKDYRVPHLFMMEVIQAESTCKKSSLTKETSLIQVCIDKENLTFKKNIKTNTDCYFSVIIEEDCEFDLPFAQVQIQSKKDKKIITINKNQAECKIEYPFIFRSIQSDDCVKTADNKYRKLLKIYSDWHVDEESKNRLVVIQQLKTPKQEICCILGEPFGFYNWIVK